MKRNKRDSTKHKDQLEISGMFSAASFAGVVSQYNEKQKWIEPENIEMPSIPIVAFYGFRGGAGRTTALAHIAAILSSRQVQVVAIDLDIEAPGLGYVLDCPKLEKNRGTVSLLRMAEIEDSKTIIRLAPHVVKSGLKTASPIRVIPAGTLSEYYLEQLVELATPLWHITPGPNPLLKIVDRVKEELAPQMIFLDCRTGLSGLSASAIFHISDVIVCFLPVSEQALDGFEVFLKGLKTAKLKRNSRPEILIVPSMVPDGPEGRQRLKDWFVPKLEECYANIILGTPIQDDNADLISEQIPIVREGIEYRRGIALTDQLQEESFFQFNSVYKPLIQQLSALLGIDKESPKVNINAGKIISDLSESVDLKNLAFAESVDPENIVKMFIQPSIFKTIIDRTTWYVVGAKGSGKTWLWTYLLRSSHEKGNKDEMNYLAGYGPSNNVLTASALRELESNKRIQMEQRHMYGALWLFYAAKILLKNNTLMAERLLRHFDGEQKRLIKLLASAGDADFQSVLVDVLEYDRAATMAEHLIRVFDNEMQLNDEPPVTLLYDGLDVGFGSDDASIKRRRKFVKALVEAVELFRGTSKNIYFKLFLREDIYAELDIQNQSHLAAATSELRWEPRDLWVLALNLMSSSENYRNIMRDIDPSAGTGRWPAEDEKRQQLLAPLWGAQMEAGKKISTATFVQRRTADGKDRLFPRTLVQLLANAIEDQKKSEMRSDRVLRSAAIQNGYKRASEKRVEDLRKEYAELGGYLDGLKGMTPTGTEDEILEHIKKVNQSKLGKKSNGETALHVGPAGWHGVIEELLEVGVIRKYKRARGEGGEGKYEIALLYRPGLGIKQFGG